jgi:hypothetical protein
VATALIGKLVGILQKENIKMSYKLEKPYTSKQRADFIVEYNHNKGLTIEETDKALYALEPWESLNGDTVIDNTDEYNKEQAELKRADLVQTLYDIKAERAYGGVIINNAFKFETNQTSITNTVGSVAFMSDTDVANWKFYSLDGAPVTYAVTKAQLYAIAKFGRDMIDKCFKVEADFNTDLAQATQDELLSDSWIQEFIENATSAMEAVVNTLTVELATTAE